MKSLSETLTELGIEFSFPIRIKNTKGNTTYYEGSSGYWAKREYSANGKQNYYENSTGFWAKREYDSNGKKTYYEDSKGVKRGTSRSKPCEDKVIEVDGIKYKLTAV